MMCRRLIINLALVLAASLGLDTAEADGLGGAETATVSPSAQLSGKYPIHVPELDGVRQLLVLSDRWVIVVSNKMHELYREIDFASAGKLNHAVEAWKRSNEKGRPDWNAYHGRWKIRDKHVARAREIIGERRLGQADFFTIQSQQDARYRQAVRPDRADYLLVSAGKSRTTGGVFDIDYHIYSYLEFPVPMRQGQTYKITLGDGNSVTFLFDSRATVSRAIKVNQLGYLPDAGVKRAYLGAYLYRFGALDLAHADRFEVIDVSSGAVALSGPVKLLEANPRFAPTEIGQDPSSRPFMYGENVYVADFSELEDEGVYFINVPGVGRSWPFRLGASVYAPALYTTLRGLYHQRAGTAATKQYTRWVRQKVPRGPYCESEHVSFPLHADGPEAYERFDVIGGSIDCSSTALEIAGGWHDAADWDSNDRHYTVIFDLLNAFAFRPQRFTDGQLDIPESGNGIPDILDEVRYGLELWRYSMDERGGVAGMLETWTHPAIDSRGVKYAFSQRTRWSSLMFAAAAAQYAQLIEAFSPEDSLLYRKAAEKAYAFGNDKRNSLGDTVIHAKKQRGRGDPYTYEWSEVESHNRPYLLHARLRLFLLTGDKSYLDQVWQLAKAAKKPYQWRFTRLDYSPWIFYSLLEAGDELPGLLVRDWRRWFIKDADGLLAHLGKSAYAVTWPRKQDYWLGWGLSDMTNFNRSLFIAFRLTGERKYRDAAILNTDYMFGANPMGMAWTTGIGFVYPVDIQHEMSEVDGIFDPVPGITIYGISGAPIYHKFRETVWQSPAASGNVDFVSHETHREPPLWRRFMVHPRENVGQNEFTIQETMSSTIFTVVMLSPEDWNVEGVALKKAPTKADELHGRWYLP